MIIIEGTIKQILQSEIRRHSKETERHRDLANKTGSKKQKQKAIKHSHKKHQTIRIAERLAFEFCEGCGRLK